MTRKTALTIGAAIVVAIFCMGASTKVGSAAHFEVKQIDGHAYVVGYTNDYRGGTSIVHHAGCACLKR